MDDRIGLISKRMPCLQAFILFRTYDENLPTVILPVQQQRPASWQCHCCKLCAYAPNAVCVLSLLLAPYVGGTVRHKSGHLCSCSERATWFSVCDGGGDDAGGDHDDRRRRRCSQGRGTVAVVAVAAVDFVVRGCG